MKASHEQDENGQRDKSRKPGPMTPAERKRRQRERMKRGLSILIELTDDEAERLARAYDLQGAYGSKLDFYTAALMTGSAFVANAGTPRGQKIKTIKPASGRD